MVFQAVATDCACRIADRMSPDASGPGCAVYGPDASGPGTPLRSCFGVIATAYLQNEAVSDSHVEPAQVPEAPWPMYDEDLLHLHGKALSGLRHSHPLRESESRDDPDHHHAGYDLLSWNADVDRRGVGAPVYPADSPQNTRTRP